MGSQKTSPIDKSIKDLIRALEVGMYNPRSPYSDLIYLLCKLEIKEAARGSLTFGAALKMESLEAVLKEVKFDDN